MTKRKIIEKLKSLKDQKNSKLNRERIIAVREAIEKETEPLGLKELCNRTEAAIGEIAPKWAEVINTVTGGTIHHWDWNSPGCLIEELSQKNIFDEAVCALFKIPRAYLPVSVQRVHKKYEEAQTQFDQGYASLIAAVESCTTAKDALAMMEKEGVDASLFDDGSEETKRGQTSLMVPLDLDLLGLKKGA